MEYEVYQIFVSFDTEYSIPYVHKRSEFFFGILFLSPVLKLQHQVFHHMFRFKFSGVFSSHNIAQIHVKLS